MADTIVERMEFLFCARISTLYLTNQCWIQLGAIMAVVVIFWNAIFPFQKPPYDPRRIRTGLISYLRKDIVMLWLKILVACVPAAVIGLLFNEKFEALFSTIPLLPLR